MRNHKSSANQPLHRHAPARQRGENLAGDSPKFELAYTAKIVDKEYDVIFSRTLGGKESSLRVALGQEEVEQNLDEFIEGRNRGDALSTSLVVYPHSYLNFRRTQMPFTRGSPRNLRDKYEGQQVQTGMYEMLRGNVPDQRRLWRYSSMPIQPQNKPPQGLHQSGLTRLQSYTQVQFRQGP